MQIRIKKAFFWLLKSAFVCVAVFKLKRFIYKNWSENVFTVKLELLKSSFDLIRKKFPNYCKLRFDDDKNESVVAVNNLSLMKQLLNSNVKLHYQMLESQIKQPFLMLDSKLEFKISQFEYEFYLKPFFKRNFMSSFFNKKFKENFQEFIQKINSSPGNSFFKSLDKLVESSSIDYLKEYYQVDSQVDELLCTIVNLSEKVNQRLTLGLILRRNSIHEVRAFTCLYKKYLERIEQLGKLVCNNDTNSFNINCLHIRFISLNIQFVQVLLKELINHLGNIQSVEIKAEICNLKQMDFIKYENVWSFTAIGELAKRAYLKALKFDVYKIDEAYTGEYFNDLHEKPLYLIFNLHGLNEQELNSLVAYYDMGFVQELVSSVLLNILSKIDVIQAFK